MSAVAHPSPVRRLSIACPSLALRISVARRMSCPPSPQCQVCSDPTIQCSRPGGVQQVCMHWHYDDRADSTLYLLLELAKGSFKDAIRRQPQGGVVADFLLRFALELASGMVRARSNRSLRSAFFVCGGENSVTLRCAHNACTQGLLYLQLAADLSRTQ